jgi:hypothetical protein
MVNQNSIDLLREAFSSMTKSYGSGALPPLRFRRIFHPNSRGAAWSLVRASRSGPQKSSRRTQPSQYEFHCFATTGVGEGTGVAAR